MFLNKQCAWSVVAILLCGACEAFAVEQIIGTVYSDSSGPSGAGTGEVRIATDRCILDLTYQKPFAHFFTSQVCNDLGALWTVEGKITHPGIGALQSVRCDGRYDAPIHSAWLVAKKYLKLIASHSYEEANLLRSDRALNSALKDDAVDVTSLDLQEYARLGGAGNCLRVLIKESDRAVMIKADQECFIGYNGIPTLLSFRIVEEQPKKNWRIDNIVASR